MRFEYPGGSESPVLIAFASDDPDKGDTLFFDWFSYKEALSPGDYTLYSGETRYTLTLPDAAARQALPGHLPALSVRKASHAETI